MVERLSAIAFNDQINYKNVSASILLSLLGSQDAALTYIFSLFLTIIGLLDPLDLAKI